MSDVPSDALEGEGEDFLEGLDDEGEGSAERQGDDLGQDDAGVDADEEGEGQGEEEVAGGAGGRRGGGGASTPRTLRRRAQEAEREAENWRTRFQEVERRERERQPDPAAERRAAEEEAELLGRLSPDEQARYYFQKGRAEFGGALRTLQIQMQDNLDRSSFQAAAASSRFHAHYQPEVERLLTEERAAGRNPPREVILDYLIGRDVRQRAAKAGPGQRKQAAGRVRAQETRPGNMRGDAATARRPSGDNYEAALARLKGQALF